MVQDMNRVIKYIKVWMLVPAFTLLLYSCEKFLNPDQELHITEDRLYDDWYEYRSVEMGLYAIQQDLVEQLLILGELRGDLLEITPNADADMVEIYHFNVSRTNRFASPTNMFKLISACNNFIRLLEAEHPEVLDPDSPVNNYDKLYGEVQCMRAWTYFNAVRIYGRVPFIHESLVTMEEIDAFIESPGTYIDSVHITFSKDGYFNDTVYNEPIELEKHYFDMELVVDHFTNLLEQEVKAVGVNHHIHNNDISWEVTIWNPFAMHALLGQMYLTQGDLVKASGHFLKIMTNPSDNYRYHIDNSFGFGSWRSIFTSIDIREHIYTVWFDKTYFQQNQFQSYFEPWIANQYMLKPTYRAILNWEAVWRGQVIDEDVNDPGESEMTEAGIPSDFYRGYGASYLYLRNGMPLSGDEYLDMLYLRAEGDERNSGAIMEGVDTTVYKYSIGRDPFSQDASYIIYRAAGIHLYMAEIYTYWAYEQNEIVRTNTTAALGILNDGSNYTLSASRPEVGIRGRVGLSGGMDGISVRNINYIHDPFTNEITGYIDLTSDFLGKQEYLEEKMLEEKAREMAFEGERFYDLMRVAKRRNDPSFLAEAVASKFAAGNRDQIYNLLLDERNWYINYFEE
jgi:hypothetical protein